MKKSHFHAEYTTEIDINSDVVHYIVFGGDVLTL
jgi:hypothetical protein